MKKLTFILDGQTYTAEKPERLTKADAAIRGVVYLTTPYREVAIDWYRPELVLFTDERANWGGQYVRTVLSGTERRALKKIRKWLGIDLSTNSVKINGLGDLPHAAWAAPRVVKEAIELMGVTPLHRDFEETVRVIHREGGWTRLQYRRGAKLFCGRAHIEAVVHFGPGAPVSLDRGSICPTGGGCYYGPAITRLVKAHILDLYLQHGDWGFAVDETEAGHTDNDPEWGSEQQARNIPKVCHLWGGLWSA